MSKMFPFITETWNPLAGECPHNCSYCWAKKLIKDKPTLRAKYQGQYRIDEKQINKKFKPNAFVFVCDMLDLFAANVPMMAVQKILNKIAAQPDVTFLILTKNPRYAWLMELPKNVVIGATIESDCDHLVSEAPKVLDRLQAMQDIDHLRKFVSIEPIMRFSDDFIKYLLSIKPEFVAVGYDNYKNGLDEPTLERTEELINTLEAVGIKVYRKTIREPVLKFKNKEGNK